MVYLNAQYSALGGLGDLWVNKISVNFLRQLDLRIIT